MLMPKYSNPFWEAFWWIFKCGSLATIIAAGWKTGHLQETTNAAIIVFVLWQGCFPFGKTMLKLNRERRISRGELNELQQMPRESLPRIANMDATGAGPVLRLTITVERNKHRSPKETIISNFVDQSREEWDHRLSTIATAAEQAPMAGLVASLLGILSGVTGLSLAMQNDKMEIGFVEMLDAMSTMVSTTIIGSAGAVLLIGLNSIARSAVNRHLAELKTTGSMLFGDGPSTQNDNESVSLF